MESPSHRTKSSNRRRSRRSRFFVWQKRHKFASVRPKELRVWRPGNRAIFSGGPKWSSTSSPSSIFLESHDLKTVHTEVFDVFCASTLRPDQRLHAVVLTCTYILIRYHGCYYRNDSAEKTFEKNTFLVNFGHPDFPTFFESVLFRVMCSRCNPQTNVGKQLLRNF